MPTLLVMRLDWINSCSIWKWGIDAVGCLVHEKSIGAGKLFACKPGSAGMEPLIMVNVIVQQVCLAQVDCENAAVQYLLASR
jgi:hypothetical protein